MDIFVSTIVALIIPFITLLNPINGSFMDIREALTAFHPGGPVGGILCLLLAQGLGFMIITKSISFYYSYWVYRKFYGNLEEVKEALEQANALPLSSYLRNSIRMGIRDKYMQILKKQARDWDRKYSE